MPRNPQKQRCTTRTRAGRPCRNYAAPGSDPPLCWQHQPPLDPLLAPDRAAIGWDAPAFFASEPECVTIDQAIAALVDKMGHLDRLIAAMARYPDRNQPRLVRAIDLYNQACSRLGRLIRDRHAIAGGETSDIPAVIAKALKDLGDEWGVDLLTPRY